MQLCASTWYKTTTHIVQLSQKFKSFNVPSYKFVNPTNTSLSPSVIVHKISCHKRTSSLVMYLRKRLKTNFFNSSCFLLWLHVHSSGLPWITDLGCPMIFVNYCVSLVCWLPPCREDIVPAKYQIHVEFSKGDTDSCPIILSKTFGVQSFWRRYWKLSRNCPVSLSKGSIQSKQQILNKK